MLVEDGADTALDGDLVGLPMGDQRLNIEYDAPRPELADPVEQVPPLP